MVLPAARLPRMILVPPARRQSAGDNLSRRLTVSRILMWRQSLPELPFGQRVWLVICTIRWDLRQMPTDCTVSEDSYLKKSSMNSGHDRVSQSDDLDRSSDSICAPELKEEDWQNLFRNIPAGRYLLQYFFLLRGVVSVKVSQVKHSSDQIGEPWAIRLSC